MLAVALMLLSGVTQSEPAAPQPGQVQGAAINGDDLTEDSCQLLLSLKGQKPALRDAPGVYVLGRSAEHPLILLPESEVKIHAVVCWRSEARLAPNDYLVLLKNGCSLFIKTETADEANDRTIVLERAGGSFRVRLVSGPDWTPDEEREMEQAIQLYIERAAAPPDESVVQGQRPKHQVAARG